MSNCIRGRIFWFLNGDQSVASARIHGINIHNKLRELGYRSIIVSKPERKTTDLKLGLIQKYYWLSQLKEGDVVFFLKLEFQFDEAIRVSLMHLRPRETVKAVL